LHTRNGLYRTQQRRPPTGSEHRGMALNNHNRQPWNATGSINGSARRNYDRYIALAREAASRGDAIEMENCYQHAEHYFRVMGGQER
jgi:hypothetical protein